MAFLGWTATGFVDFSLIVWASILRLCNVYIDSNNDLDGVWIQISLPQFDSWPTCGRATCNLVIVVKLRPRLSLMCISQIFAIESFSSLKTSRIRIYTITISPNSLSSSSGSNHPYRFMHDLTLHKSSSFAWRFRSIIDLKSLQMAKAHYWKHWDQHPTADSTNLLPE